MPNYKMIMKELSYQFPFKYGKKILLGSSIVTGIALLSFMFFYPLWETTNKIGVFCFLMLYISASSIFDYYLIKSKLIKYDYNSFFIQSDSDNWEEIPIKRLIKITRTYHYFYTLHFRCQDSSVKKIVFFISPNPSFLKSKKVKEVLDYASKNLIRERRQTK
jgi:hypothetical protein